MLILSEERKLHLIFAQGSKSSREWKFLGTRVPGNESSRERKYEGAKDESSCYLFIMV